MAYLAVFLSVGCVLSCAVAPAACKATVAVMAPVVELTAVETVTHTVPPYAAAVVECTPFVPAVSPVAPPAVPSTVSDVDVRTAEVQVVAVRIVGVYGKMPHTVGPVQRPVEVRCGTECTVLPVEQDVAKVEVALPPVRLVEVVRGIDAHQVVEVNLVSGVILLFGEVQFIGHLVGEEQGLLPCLFVAHGRDCGRQRKKHCQGCYQSFHDQSVFNVILVSAK